jgi:acetyl esterase/lipase
MNRLPALVLVSSVVLAFACTSTADGMVVKKDIAYGTEHERQKLDIYAPDDAAGKKLPVVFWIHGGGWQAGDKSDVKLKPQFFIDQGCVFVSTNYRLYPHVDMATLIGDTAQSLGWVSKHIAEYGGDAGRIIVGGHSAGAQLAAILCTDERYLKAHDVSFTSLRGCIPVDGDTYWIPAIIATAELRAHLYGTPQPGKSGHRAKFGNDPEKHLDFSAVTHVAKGKNIPAFLIIYVSGHPDTSAQARKLAEALTKAEVANTPYGGRETSHSKINNDIGVEGDPGTAAVIKFLESVLKK